MGVDFRNHPFAPGLPPGRVSKPLSIEEGTTFNYLKDFRSEHDSTSQGQNLALNVLYVPYLLNSGVRICLASWRREQCVFVDQIRTLLFPAALQASLNRAGPRLSPQNGIKPSFPNASICAPSSRQIPASASTIQALEKVIGCFSERRSCGATTYTLHFTPYTPHTPYTHHPTPYTKHPTPYTLHPTPYTLHPASHTRHPAPYTLHPAPHTLHPTP